MRKSKPLGISTGVKKLWKGGPLAFSFLASGFTPAPERLALPLSLRARPVWIRLPTYRGYETARDCRRLARLGQAKNARRLVLAFTHHAQLFHKHNPCAISRKTKRNPAKFSNVGRNANNGFTLVQDFA